MIALAALVAGCSSGGTPDGGGLSVTPANLTVFAGSGPVQLTVTGNYSQIAWQLDKALAGASLSAATGVSTAFTPPASVTTNQDVKVVASVPGTAISGFAKITVAPAKSTSGTPPVNPARDAGTGTPGGGAVGPRLWIPGSTGTVTGFPVAALGSSGSLAASGATTLTWTGGTVPTAIAFDKSGMLWIANFFNVYPDGSQLLGYTILSDGGLQASVTLKPSSGKSISPHALAFASNGDLWVADYNDWALLRYSAGQLAASGAPLPTTTIGFKITDAGYQSLVDPNDIAFDIDGNLWVANRGGNTVMMFAPDSVNGLGSDPSVQIYDTTGTLASMDGLAFDSSGYLWIASVKSNAIVRIQAHGLNGPTQLNPITVVSTPDGGSYAPLNGLRNIAFDVAGNLWVINGDGTLVRFGGPSSFTGRVSPVPAASFTGAPVTDVGRMQFY